MLSSPLFIDIDPPLEEKQDESFEWIIDMAYKTLEFFETTYNIEYNSISFSGNGIHIMYENFDWNTIKSYNPKERIELFKTSRIVIWEALIIKGIIADYECIADPFRIKRLPGSINSKTNLPCFDLSLKELRSLPEMVQKYREVLRSLGAS